MKPVRLRLGELLVDAKILHREQLDEVLEAQRKDGRRLGTILVERGLVNETQLTQILSHQLSVPWVSLYHVDFSKRLLSLVPRHVAEKFCLVPIYIRRVRGQGDTLYVAMDDPTNLEALRTCASWSGLPTRAMIAAPSDIQSAISVYYGAESAPQSTTPTDPAKAVLPVEPLEQPAAEQPAGEAPVAAVEEMAAAQPPAVPPEESGVAEMPTAAPEQLVASERVSAPADAVSAQPDETKSAEALDLETGVDVAALETALKTAESVAPQEPTDAASVAGPVVGVEADLEAIEPIEELSDEAVSVEVGEEISLEELLGARRSGESKAVAPAASSGSVMSLTLLDGTTITLPVARRAQKRRQDAGTLVRSLRQREVGGQVPPAQQEEAAESERPERTSEPPPEHVDYPGDSPGMTGREVVAALRAAAHGVDATETLGRHGRWETFAALVLALLLRKEVITEQELVDELRRL